MTRACSVVGTLGFVAALLACDPRAGTPGDVEPSREAIIGGSVDTAHPAVVALLGAPSLCTATIVSTSGGVGWALTAANCVSPSAPTQVVQGGNYSSPDQTYPVVDVRVHPSYAGSFTHDFALVRFTGASAATPVLPTLTADDDRLSPGTPVRYVGYGLLSYPSGTTTRRHQTVLPVSSLDATTFSADTPSSGPCLGDVGGPGLVVAGGVDYVGGVVSGGDPTCSIAVVSGRVSAVVDWIASLVDAMPPDPCDSCSASAVAPSGDCYTASEACLGDSACSELHACIESCTTRTCRSDCVSTHASGVPLYEAMTGCTCSACPVCACGTGAPDAGAPDAGGMAPDAGASSPSDGGASPIDAAAGGGSATRRGDGGCGCRVASGSERVPMPPSAALFGLVGLAAAWRRRARPTERERRRRQMRSGRGGAIPSTFIPPGYW